MNVAHLFEPETVHEHGSYFSLYIGGSFSLIQWGSFSILYLINIGGSFSIFYFKQYKIGGMIFHFHGGIIFQGGLFSGIPIAVVAEFLQLS